MLILDGFLRIASITLLSLAAILAWRDGRASSRLYIFILLACASTAIMLIGTAPVGLRLPSPAHEIIHTLDAGNIVFIWWFGLALFIDDFKLGLLHWSVLALTMLIMIPVRLSAFTDALWFPAWANYLMDGLTLGMMGHLLFITLKGWRDDLVDSRRKCRLYFTVAMVVATLAATMSENIWGFSAKSGVSILKALITFPIAVWSVLWLTRFQPEKCEFTTAEETRVPLTPKIDPRDKLLLDQLNTAMEKEEAFKEPGLTIRSLSDKLAAPEHRLRVLINKGLGYRNFSAYLNNYRIEAVKAAFAAPENSRIPVLTLAMDVGYNSLAPFNKAFRDRENMTPSAYRQTLLAEADG